MSNRLSSRLARLLNLVPYFIANPGISPAEAAEELGVSKETLRVWVRKHKETGAGTPAESIDLEAENRRLRAELAEAKRANDILKKASAFFAAELDRPQK